MVRKFLKFLAFLLFFIFALVAFMPKKSFYFLLEKELQNFELVISNERLHEKLISLEIENLELSTKGIDSAVIESAEITLFGLYNCLTLKDIQVSSLIDTYAPSKIESLEVSYTLLNPLKIKANALGDFGEAELGFTLLEGQLKIVVKPSKLMQTRYKKTMSMLKKDEDGEYVYAKTF